MKLHFYTQKSGKPNYGGNYGVSQQQLWVQNVNTHIFCCTRGLQSDSIHALVERKDTRSMKERDGIINKGALSAAPFENIIMAKSSQRQSVYLARDSTKKLQEK